MNVTPVVYERCSSGTLKAREQVVRGAPGVHESQFSRQKCHHDTYSLKIMAVQAVKRAKMIGPDTIQSASGPNPVPLVRYF